MKMNKEKILMSNGQIKEMSRHDLINLFRERAMVGHYDDIADFFLTQRTSELNRRIEEVLKQAEELSGEITLVQKDGSIIKDEFVSLTDLKSLLNKENEEDK